MSEWRSSRVNIELIICRAGRRVNQSAFDLDEELGSGHRPDDVSERRVLVTTSVNVESDGRREA